MMKDSYITLNNMLMANNISPQTVERIICHTLRFLQFQTICDILRMNKAEYSRWLTLSRQLQQPTEFARRITKALCQCQLDEYSYELIGQWLLAFYRRRDTRVIYPKTVRTELLKQQNCQCSICGGIITEKAELDHIVPWMYVGDELPNNLQLLCKKCNSSKKASPLYQMRMLLPAGAFWTYSA